MWVYIEYYLERWAEVERQVFTVKANDMDVMIRLAGGYYIEIFMPPELDAVGKMMIHITSTETARYIVQTSHFHPIGMRPADGGSSDGPYRWYPVQITLNRPIRLFLNFLLGSKRASKTSNPPILCIIQPCSRLARSTKPATSYTNYKVQRSVGGATLE